MRFPTPLNPNPAIIHLQGHGDINKKQPIGLGQIGSSSLGHFLCVLWCASTANQTNELKSVHHAN